MPRSFRSGATLYDPYEEKDVDVGKVEVQIKPDPTDDNNYRLHFGGKRVFQWFKEKYCCPVKKYKIIYSLQI